MVLETTGNDNRFLRLGPPSTGGPRCTLRQPLLELEHVREAQGYNGYPDLLLTETREEIKGKKREEEEATTVTTGVKKEDKKRPVIIPYIRGFSEELKRTFGAYGIPTYFKPTNTLRQLLAPPERPSGEGQSCGPSVQDKL